MTTPKPIDFSDLVASIQARGGLVQPFVLNGQDPNGHTQQFIFEGMTMRQHYAGLAMQALVAKNPPNGLSREEIAKQAFKMADEMLEVQKK